LGKRNNLELLGLFLHGKGIWAKKEAETGRITPKMGMPMLKND